MSDLFSIEGRLFRFTTKASNLILLNLLWIIFSLPIITMGAATAAVYYVTLKMVRDEEGYIIRSFLKAFKQNLKQGIIIQIIFTLCGVILAADIYYFLKMGNRISYIFIGVFSILLILYIFSLIFIFPLLSKYENTIIGTFKNALTISLKHFPITIGMVILSGCMLYGFYVSVPIMLIILGIGVSLFAYVFSILLHGIFDKFF
jgi:uncharacterized membrane protein YesL